jgi:hypothetical protein
VLRPRALRRVTPATTIVFTSKYDGPLFTVVVDREQP